MDEGMVEKTFVLTVTSEILHLVQHLDAFVSVRDSVLALFS